jgi:hypothetical protein
MVDGQICSVLHSGMETLKMMQVLGRNGVNGETLVCLMSFLTLSEPS